MPDIHIKVSDVQRIKSELAKADKAIAAALKSVESALTSADWSDANSRAFATDFDAARRKAEGFTKDAVALNRFLGKVIDQAKALGG